MPLFVALDVTIAKGNTTIVFLRTSYLQMGLPLNRPPRTPKIRTVLVKG
jgi:hypothetical protein